MERERTLVLVRIEELRKELKSAERDELRGVASLATATQSYNVCVEQGFHRDVGHILNEARKVGERHTEYYSVLTRLKEFLHLYQLITGEAAPETE